MSNSRNKLLKNKVLATKYFLLATALFFCIYLNGQDSLACQSKWLGDSLYKSKKYSEAISKYKSSLKIFEKNNNWSDWETAFRGLQNSALKMKNIQLIDSLNIYFSVVPNSEHYVKAKCYYNTAYAYARMDYVSESNTLYKKSLEVFLSIFENSMPKNLDKYISSTYKNLSFNCSRLGDTKTAIQYASKGAEFSQEIQNQSNLCQFLSLKGKYYFLQERFDKALKQYNDVFDLCGEKIWLHDYIAELQLKLNNLPLAKIHIDRFRELAASEEELPFQYYLLKSNLSKKMHLHDDAIRYQRIALNLLEESSNLRVYIKELAIFSKYLYSLGKKEKSIKTVQKGLSMFFKSIDSTNILDRPKISEELPGIWIIESLGMKAKYFSEKYNDEKNSQDLEEAKFYYEALFQYFNKTKNEYNSTTDQYKLGSYTQNIYSESIQFLANLFKQENKFEHFEKALELAQSANAYVLKNSVLERQSLELAGVPSDTINKFLQLKMFSNDSDEDDPNAIHYLNQFNSFKKKLKREYPAIDNLQKDKIISLNDLQNALDASSILVKYHYGNNQLTRFAITNNEVQLDLIELPQDFDSLINDYQNIISNPKSWDTDKYAKISQAIYNVVIEDVLESPKFSNMEHLIIAPDGPIKKISFNSLVTQIPEKILQVEDYLINDYEISYLYYCEQISNKNISSKKENGFIGFGIEYNDQFLDELVKEFQSRNSEDSIVRNLTLSPLKYAKTEAISSANILNGESIINEDATLQNVLKNISDFDLVHFSTHAFVDNEDYMNSFIALSKGQDEEYQFKYEDILNLNLDADLVVLSACQTSSGTNISGEGLMSLSRAFVQSGCKSTMGAYWNAPDLSTMKLMELFYSNLKEGISKSKALRQAQIEYLTNETYGTPRTKSPFFWSSWAIYGDNAPIPEINGSLFAIDNKWMFILIGSALVFLIFFFRVKRKTN